MTIACNMVDGRCSNIYIIMVMVFPCIYACWAPVGRLNHMLCIAAATYATYAALTAGAYAAVSYAAVGYAAVAHAAVHAGKTRLATKQTTRRLCHKQPYKRTRLAHANCLYQAG